MVVGHRRRPEWIGLKGYICMLACRHKKRDRTTRCTGRPGNGIKAPGMTIRSMVRFLGLCHPRACIDAVSRAAAWTESLSQLHLHARMCDGQTRGSHTVACTSAAVVVRA